MFPQRPLQLTPLLSLGARRAAPASRVQRVVPVLLVPLVQLAPLRTPVPRVPRVQLARVSRSRSPLRLRRHQNLVTGGTISQLAFSQSGLMTATPRNGLPWALLWARPVPRASRVPRGQQARRVFPAQQLTRVPPVLRDSAVQASLA